MKAQAMTLERLKGHEGAKLGKVMRRRIKEQVHDLYEQATLLRLLDPSFEKQLEKWQALPFLAALEEEFNRRREERIKTIKTTARKEF